jgi:hypothetical protein
MKPYKGHYDYITQVIKVDCKIVSWKETCNNC